MPVMIMRLLFPCLLAFILSKTTWAQDEPAELTPKQAKAAFAKADAALNAAWAEAKKALPPEEFTALKEDQKGWLELRDVLALSPSYSGAPDDEDEAKASPEYLSTAAALMDDRVRWLRGFIADGYGDSLTGTWEDSRGGHINIVEEEGKILFILETVRGHTADLGQLAGVATWNHPIGWFSDKGRDEEKEQETNLAFVWHERLLEVTGANTEHYHGKRAWLDGRYVKTGELDDKAATRVKKAAKTGEIPEEE